MLVDLGNRIDQTLARRAGEDDDARARAEARRARAGPTLFDTSGGVASPEDERIRRERLAEKRAMEKRKPEIEREIREEPDRIRRRFAVQTVRLEPVGIVYLWPEKG